MTLTTKPFKDLGFRTMPIRGQKMIRNNLGKKVILDNNGIELTFNEAMPTDWTRLYGQNLVKYQETALGGLICGKLAGIEKDEIEVIALDCDDANSFSTVRALDPTNPWVTKSIGKPGGTVFYRLPEALKAVEQFSTRTPNFKFEYMAKRASGVNSMVYLPTSANETKEPLCLAEPPPFPPEGLVGLILSLKPEDIRFTAQAESLHSEALPHNAPLVEKFVVECENAAEDGQEYGKLEHNNVVARRVYSIFTPKRFRDTAFYKANGYIHPNDDDLQPYSEYIIGVSAIAGADLSISPELYIQFMNAINAQIDMPYVPQRYLAEVIRPMLEGKAKINGAPIWTYQESWDKDSFIIANQYGDQVEYFANEEEVNTFLEYNHTTKTAQPINGIGQLVDRMYTLDSAPESDKIPRSVVKKLKLIREINTVQKEPGIYINDQGRLTMNTVRAEWPLQVLRNPELYPEHVDDSSPYAQAFDLLIRHLVNGDEAATLFIKQVLAYHGKNLEAIPVILYIVGVGGAGKSHFAFLVEKLFGSNTTRRPSPRQLTGQYNDFLENCAVLILSETGDAPRSEQMGIKSILKQVTGERTIDIEAKFKPIKPNVPVFALPILLTNTPWYQEDSNDRRLLQIMPVTTLEKAEDIIAFEDANGIRLIEFIEEGIKKGIISKWLRTCYDVDILPPVPKLENKFSVADTTSDPIARLKHIINNENFVELFELFEDFEISAFFTVMKNTKLEGRRNYLYRNHLVELVKEMREGGAHPTDDVIVKAFAPNNWLEQYNECESHTAGSGPLSYRKVGRYKWRVPGLLRAYEEWCLDTIGEE